MFLIIAKKKYFFALVVFPIDCFPQENAGSAQNNSMGGKHRELDKKVSKLRKMVQVFIIIIIIIITQQSQYFCSYVTMNERAKVAVNCIFCNIAQGK